MPDKPPRFNDAREVFCQEKLLGAGNTAAYLKAYPKSQLWESHVVWVRGSTLARRPEIKQRMKELRSITLDKLKITVEDHLEELKTIRDKAMSEGKYSAAVAAEVSRGKVCGFYVTQVRDVTDPLTRAAANYTPEQAQKMLSALDEVAAIHAKAKKQPTAAA